MSLFNVFNLLNNRFRRMLRSTEASLICCEPIRNAMHFGNIPVRIQSYIFLGINLSLAIEFCAQ